jgi:leucyl/phenylalanyl-tRNA--protein transferase
MRTGPDWEAIVATADDEELPVAISGSLDPVSLLDAYCNGVFPFPTDDSAAIEVNQALYEDDVACGRIHRIDDGNRAQPYSVTWWCPAWRPVIPKGALRLSRTLTREVRRSPLVTTCDIAYADVLYRCGLRRRRRWLTDELCASLVDLHRQGWAHSIEVWQEQTLVAGLVGVGIGHVFTIDTAFTTVSGGVKLAVCDLHHRLAATPVELLDVQVPSSHMSDLGASLMKRAHFRPSLASRQRVSLDRERYDAPRLVAR